MKKLTWYLKQLLPLTYVSHYGEKGSSYVCAWRMWFGRCFAIRTWQVAG